MLLVFNVMAISKPVSNKFETQFDTTMRINNVVTLFRSGKKNKKVTDLCKVN